MYKEYLDARIYNRNYIFKMLESWLQKGNADSAFYTLLDQYNSTDVLKIQYEDLPLYINYDNPGMISLLVMWRLKIGK